MHNRVVRKNRRLLSNEERGFGAQVVRTLGAWDYPTRPALYWSYTVAMPRILALLRARGRAQTRRFVE
jgi:hypothetical protein